MKLPNTLLLTTTLLTTLALAAPNNANNLAKEGTMLESDSSSASTDAIALSDAESEGNDMDAALFPLCGIGYYFCRLGHSGCCPQSYFCCPYGCCPPGFPYCGRDGRCYAGSF